jgi:ArsR family transcriptional regulator
MHDDADVARLLDILGNRNRRRIIELLRQKPCFVTEISETLTLSPKAVIDHLQMMEREAILSSQTDERRRKYYYLANDILIDISTKEVRIFREGDQGADTADMRLQKSISILGRMIRAHDQILENLEQINHDIAIKINDIARNHKDLFRSEREIAVILALSHDSLTVPELERATGISGDVLPLILNQFERHGLVKRIQNTYTLRGIHAE